MNVDAPSLIRLNLWDISAREPEKLDQISFDANEFVLSPDGKWIAYTSLKDSTIRVYDISSGKFAEKGSFDPPVPDAKVLALRFEGDPSQL